MLVSAHSSSSLIGPDSNTSLSQQKQKKSVSFHPDVKDHNNELGERQFESEEAWLSHEINSFGDDQITEFRARAYGQLDKAFSLFNSHETPYTEAEANNILQSNLHHIKFMTHTSDKRPPQKLCLFLLLNFCRTLNMSSLLPEKITISRSDIRRSYQDLLKVVKKQISEMGIPVDMEADIYGFIDVEHNKDYQVARLLRQLELKLDDINDVISGFSQQLLEQSRKSETPEKRSREYVSVRSQKHISTESLRAIFDLQLCLNHTK